MILTKNSDTTIDIMDCNLDTVNFQHCLSFSGRPKKSKPKKLAKLSNKWSGN